MEEPKKSLKHYSEMMKDPNIAAGMDALERSGVAWSLTPRERAMAMFWAAAIEIMLKDFQNMEGRAMAMNAVMGAALMLVSEEELHHVLDAAEVAMDTIDKSG